MRPPPFLLLFCLLLLASVGVCAEASGRSTGCNAAFVSEYLANLPKPGHPLLGDVRLAADVDVVLHAAPVWDREDDTLEPVLNRGDDSSTSCDSGVRISGDQ